MTIYSIILLFILILMIILLRYIGKQSKKEQLSKIFIIDILLMIIQCTSTFIQSILSDYVTTDFMFKMINKNNPSSGNIFESLKFNIKQRLILMRYGLGVRKSLYRKPINYQNQEELNRALQNYINKNGIPLTEEEKQTGILIEMRPPRDFDKPFCVSSSPTFQKVLKEDVDGDLLKIENLGVVERCEWEKV